MAFAGLEGMPDERADFGFGQICATLANIHRREGQDAYRAEDFMPALRCCKGGAMRTSYYDEDDILVIHLSDKAICREVS